MPTGCTEPQPSKRSAPTVLANDSRVEVPVPTSFQLPNGIEVWSSSSHQVPLVTLSVIARVGSIADPPGREGTAQLMVDMLDEGAGARSSVQIAEEIDFLGSDLSLTCQKEYIEVSLTVLKKNLDEALDIVADIVQRPTFDKKEWDRVHTLDVNEVAQRQEEPTAVARVVSERAFYGDAHPFSHPPSGYLRSVKGIRLEDVQGFYAEHIGPAVTSIVAAGDIQAQELKERLAPRFGQWRSPAKLPTSPPPRREAGPRLVVVDKPDAPQTVIYVLVPAPRYVDPDVPALSLANMIFGGTFTSRLVTNLRETNKFTYGASSAMAARSVPSHLAVGTSVHAVKTGAALTEIWREFRAIETGSISSEELAKSRATQAGRTVEALETQASTLGLFRFPMVLGQPPDARRKLQEAMEKVTDAEVSAAAMRWLRWDGATVVLVGDEKLIRSELEALQVAPPTGPGGATLQLPEPQARGRDGEGLGES